MFGEAGFYRFPQGSNGDVFASFSKPYVLVNLQDSTVRGIAAKLMSFAGRCSKVSAQAKAKHVEVVREMQRRGIATLSDNDIAFSLGL